MSQQFTSLIDDFIDQQIGISEDFLPISLCTQLRNNLIQFYKDQQLHHAGTGNSGHVNHEAKMRSDQIFWLDPSHHNEHEDAFFLLMDQFVQCLNETCYAGINAYEFHYTMYEAGSYYKRHLDQFKNNSSRKYSMIFYLNENWKEADGGQLCMYKNGEARIIEPKNGRIVFFKSDETEHEVLVCHAPRMSITGWLKSE